MTNEVISGQAAQGEAITEAAQANAATTSPQTGGADGGEQSQVAKTFSQDEVNDIVKRAKAATESKTERRVLKLLGQVLPQQQQAPQQQASPDQGKPLRSQFATEDQWLDARDAWRDEQREAKANEDRQREAHKSSQEKTEKIYADAQKIPGFDREAFDDLAREGHLTRHMVEALLESDHGAKLMAHMAANPAEMERIAKLPGTRQVVELGKLEDKVSAPTPRTSKTPDPINPLGRGNTSVAGDLSKLPMDQYIEQRKKQGARWAN